MFDLNKGFKQVQYAVLSRVSQVLDWLSSKVDVKVMELELELKEK